MANGRGVTSGDVAAYVLAALVALAVAGAELVLDLAGVDALVSDVIGAGLVFAVALGFYKLGRRLVVT